MKKIGILIFAILVLVSCNMTVKENQETEKKESLGQKEEIKSNIEQSELIESVDTTIIELDYGIRIVFSKNEDFEIFKIYWDTKIYFDSILVYSDSSTEFEINKIYPLVRKFGNKIAIFLNHNDRPHKNKLKMITFSNNQFENIEVLPLFKMEPRDIDNDNTLELVGVYGATEVWGDDTVYMTYNPILIYELVENGIIMDSVETEKINIHIYDKFYGYEYDSEISFVYRIMSDTSNKFNTMDTFNKVLEKFDEFK